jgi:hypothetical protein
MCPDTKLRVTTRISHYEAKEDLPKLRLILNMETFISPILTKL